MAQSEKKTVGEKQASNVKSGVLTPYSDGYDTKEEKTAASDKATAQKATAQKAESKPAAAEVTSKSDKSTGPGELPVNATVDDPPRDGPELPVIEPIPGSNYSGTEVEPADTGKKAKTVDYTCPSCNKSFDIASSDKHPTCNDCGVPLVKD